MDQLRLDKNEFVSPVLYDRVVFHIVHQLLREVNIAYRGVLSGNISVLIKENDSVGVRIVDHSSFFGGDGLRTIICIFASSMGVMAAVSFSGGGGVVVEVWLRPDRSSERISVSVSR